MALSVSFSFSCCWSIFCLREGTVVCADHTHAIPRSIKRVDSSVDKTFAPAQAMFGVCNEKGQVMALTLCKSTTKEERQKISKNLKNRYVSRDLPMPTFVQDNCCSDTWTASDFPGAAVMLDNFHLISRYGESCRASKSGDAMRQRLLMKDIARLIADGSDKVTCPEEGDRLYERVSKTIEAFQRKEEMEGIAPGDRIVKEKLLHTHRTQRQHYQRCLGLPRQIQPTIVDRFGVHHVRRGSHKIEQVWRTLKMCFPEKCSIDFASNLLLAAMTDHNFSREIQFSPAWKFLAIPITYLSVTQYLLMSKPPAIIESGDGALSMFDALPLGEIDQDVFGLTSAFDDSLPSFTEIDCRILDDLCFSFTHIVEFATLNEATIDNAVETLLTQSSEVDCMEDTVDDHQRIQKRYREFAPLSHDAGMLSQLLRGTHVVASREAFA